MGYGFITFDMCLSSSGSLLRLKQIHPTGALYLWTSNFCNNSRTEECLSVTQFDSGHISLNWIFLVCRTQRTHFIFGIPQYFWCLRVANMDICFCWVVPCWHVISFLEMRTKFDHGEDPMDPESQHHQNFHRGFHGFQGFNPFGSGPFNFKFNFNWGGSCPAQLARIS